MSLLALAAVLGPVCVITLSSFFKKYRKPSYSDLPPVVNIPDEEIFQRPREAYAKALRDHGHIVGVWKKGRLEYIVDDHLTREVLTSEHLSFSEGAFTYLNIHYLHKYFTGYFIELEEIVRNCIMDRMPLIVDQVAPVFMKQASLLMESTNPTSDTSGSANGHQYVNFLDHTHKAISQAMATIIFGPHFLNQKSLDIIERIASDLAVASGLYQNRSWWGRKFPKLWRIWKQVKMAATTLPTFYRVVGLQVWNDIRGKHFDSDMKTDGSEGCVLGYLSKRFARADGEIGILGFMKISGLLIGIIFASVHLTATIAVWVTYELTVRPEYLPALREEMFSQTSIDPENNDAGITFNALRDSPLLDSFIREVLRTKGDVLSPVRFSTADINLGGYTVPKGHLVLVFSPSSHFSTSYHGPNAADFDGKRWISTDKQAVTISQSYLLFGLGRWACPGRVLAVTEIKMIIWSIICRATPVLKGNAYRIVDPLEVSATPPDGELTLLPYSH